MGIIRGGDSEYEEHKPSFEEKTDKWQNTLKPMLEEEPDSLKLSGKYIANDDVKIICDYEGLKNAPSVGSYLHRNYKNVYPYERIE